MDFTHTLLGNTGLKVHRLGLSATYWPGRDAIRHALESGLNTFFAFSIDLQMMRVLAEVPRNERSRFVLLTGAYNMVWGYPNLRRTLEKRLRQFKTDYIDVFLFLGVTSGRQFPERAREEMYRLKEEGKVRFVGMSCHDRAFAGRMAAEGALDVLMIRYNAAHRGAERDIFPHVSAHHPGIVSYTATRWHALLQRPRRWPEDRPRPSAGQLYRFVLTNPHVHVCLTAPRNLQQLKENIAALDHGPLDEDEVRFAREFGDVVYQQKKWFM